MKLTDSELAFLEHHHSAAMVTVTPDGIAKVARVGVALIDGTDAPALNLALFRRMQGKRTGPLSWFGGELDDEAFVAQMAAEQRLIYEFEPHHTYGLH